MGPGAVSEGSVSTPIHREPLTPEDRDGWETAEEEAVQQAFAEQEHDLAEQLEERDFEGAAIVDDAEQETDLAAFLSGADLTGQLRARGFPAALPPPPSLPIQGAAIVDDEGPEADLAGQLEARGFQGAVAVDEWEVPVEDEWEPERDEHHQLGALPSGRPDSSNSRYPRHAYEAAAAAFAMADEGIDADEFGDEGIDANEFYHDGNDDVAQNEVSENIAKAKEYLRSLAIPEEMSDGVPDDDMGIGDADAATSTGIHEETAEAANIGREEVECDDLQHDAAEVLFNFLGVEPSELSRDNEDLDATNTDFQMSMETPAADTRI
jgi:hypothetical protein